MHAVVKWIMLSSILGPRHGFLRSSNRALAVVCRNRLLSPRPLDFSRTVVTSSTTSNATTDTTTISAAKEFKKIPVDPTILNYIDMIGVGRINVANLKASRTLRRKRRKGSEDGLLSEAQEKDFFKDQELRNRVMRENRPTRRMASTWLPPPPFGFTLRSQG